MKTLTTALALALVSSTAFAADAFFPYGSDTPTYNWTFGYLGANIGYGGGKHEVDASIIGTPLRGSISATTNGFIGGAQAGYNWQSGSVVYGIEGDFQYADINAKLAAFTNLFGTGISASASGSLSWLGTLRARIGFVPEDRFFLYATGGAAFGKLGLSGEVNVGSIPYRDEISKTRTGWTLGAGAEYAVTDDWTWKTEYLYTDLGKWTFYEDPVLKAETGLKFHTVRTGMNYRF